MKKRLVIASAVVMGGLATIVGTMGITNAASATHSGTHAGIIKRVGGERAHVKLNQAERDGTITAAQKTAFTAEVKKLREERKSVITSTSTTAQKQTERTTLKNELKAWATTNNFPLAKIFPKLAA